jgi:hypothetical protein
MAKEKNPEDVKFMGSTKKEVWDALKVALGRSRPVAEATTESVKKEAATGHAIEVAAKHDVANTQTLLESILSAGEQYNDLCLAITAKTEELDNVHGIVVQADTLTALVEAKNAILEEKKSEAVRIEEEADEYKTVTLAETTTTVQEMMDKVTRDINSKKQEAERETEVYVYGFKRQQQKDQDNLQDALDVHSKSLDEREVALKVRETQADDKDNRIETLNNDLAAVNASVTEKVEAAAGRAKGMAESSAKIQTNVTTREHEAEITVLDGTIDARDITIESLTAQVTKLESAVEAANSKGAEIAKAALDASHANSTIESMQKALEQIASGKK